MFTHSHAFSIRKVGGAWQVAQIVTAECSSLYLDSGKRWLVSVCEGSNRCYLSPKGDGRREIVPVYYC